MDEQVEDAAESLEGDFQRKGEVDKGDVARVVAKRGLSLDQFQELLRELKHRGLEVLDADDGENAGDPSPSQVGLTKGKYLSLEEEQSLANAIRLAKSLKEDGEKENEYIEEGRRARDKFILSNIRLVHWVANRWRGSRLDYDDVVQEGIKGLIRAVEMFDPDLGYRFSTYATWWIEQAIRRGIDNNSDEVRIPVHRLEQIRRYRKMERRLRFETGSEPTVSSVAAALGWSLELAAFISNLTAFRTVALDSPLSAHSTLTIRDGLPDNRIESPEDQAMQVALRNLLDEMFADLKPRERNIVIQRFGLEGRPPRTLEDLGQEYGVTRERIRQIEAKALVKLKHPSRARKLRGFYEE